MQKGPFLNGTALQITELDSKLVPTGKNYSAQLLDNRGSFEVRNVELVSQYVQLKADGFYFNEVSGKNSAAQLTLYALSDLKEKSSLNVNLLSTLEKGRIDYLLSRGDAFAAAKARAQREILAIFKMDTAGVAESELLDITKPGDGNAKLLALSVILQGYRDVAGLSEFIANIATDIREDGELDSESLGNALVSSARSLNSAEIRDNLESRYEDLGLSVTVPDFELHLRRFVERTDYTFSKPITYPDTLDGHVNLLAREDGAVVVENQYVLAAHLPEYTRLKIKVVGGKWGRIRDSQVGISNGAYNHSDSSVVYTTTAHGDVRASLVFLPKEVYPDSMGYQPPPSGPTRILVFENESETPAFVREFLADN